MTKRIHSKLDYYEMIRDIARSIISKTYVPASVYRLQFNKNFTFKKAAELIPYLAQMGISAVYCSPYFESLPGSMHGYDIVNPNQLDPELGTEQDYERLVQVLKKHSIEQIVDIVPNHMGVLGIQNKWWYDVLENGQNSIYADYFDIDWDPEKKELHAKVLIPILGDSYGKILEDREIQLDFDDEKGEFYVTYWEHRLPIAPSSYAFILDYEIRDLQDRLGENNKAFLELLSIITSFRSLPEIIYLDRLKKLERDRAKEHVKQRLRDLIKQSPQIASYIRDQVILFNGHSDEPSTFDLMHQLLSRQYYRVAYWRVASEEVNYRRFFDVNALAAIRVEDAATFRHYHEKMFDLLSKGYVKGIRVDHTDGLYDPKGYLRSIQKELLIKQTVLEITEQDSKSYASPSQRETLYQDVRSVIEEQEFDKKTSVFMVVEKVLDRKETLPWNWSIHGTVGYEYLNSLNGLFIHQSSEKMMTENYESFIGENIDFAELVYQKKKYFALIHMASEMNALGHRLDSITEKNRHYQDFTLNNLTLAIREVIACFPVYRSYISPEDSVVSKTDAKYINIAIQKAKTKTPALNPDIYDFLKSVLTMNFEVPMTDEEKQLYKDFALRFQQMTGPVMAKGLEDTVFYIYNRLLSLNEVGGDPVHFGTSAAEFHRHNQENHVRWPYSFITTYTHDTKRSEDARHRINVLTEMPKRWKSQVARWQIVNKKYKTLIKEELKPSANTEYFIYQTLLSLWTREYDLNPNDQSFKDRIWQIIQKSLREAKLETNWINPNEEYEAAVRSFLESILKPHEQNLFLKRFIPFQRKLSELAILNSISSTVLKLGNPGVIDVFQGSELWDYRQVDPDNRSKIDFKKRFGYLKGIQSLDSKVRRSALIADLYRNRDNGKLKMYLLWKGLQTRKAHSELFLKGEYIPLEVKGRKKDNVVAYARFYGNQFALVVAARYFHHLQEKGLGIFTGKGAWRGTWIQVPKTMAPLSYRDIFTDQIANPERNRKGLFLIPVWQVLQSLNASISLSQDKE